MTTKCKTVFMLLTIIFAAMPLLAAPVPDTGQTKCYNDSVEIPCPSPDQDYYGQYGNYTINPMSYTKLDTNGNALSNSVTSWSMVKDNVTGLTWEVKTNKDGAKNYSDPHDADNTYTWYDSNPATNGGNAGTAGNGTDTEDFIKALNDANYGGFNDWRLPTIKELAYIVKYSIPYPGPTIDSEYFPNTAGSVYWSYTTSKSTSSAWVVAFHDGSPGTNNKYFYNYVRAVRGGQSGLLGNLVIGSLDSLTSLSMDEDEAAAGSYTDNGDGTVTDTATGLTWQQETPDNTITWQQALAYCEGLSLGGHTDWRLPNIKELLSLVDTSRFYPAINTTYFPDTVWMGYWSSTTYASSTSGAWYVNFYYGNGDDSYKSYSRYVRAVRGGQSGSFGNLVISQQPISGPPGTTFVQWGTGFTPNSTATLHFKKPDGTEYPTKQQPIDAIGHFEISYTAPWDKPLGTYIWWAIDGVTGAKSNEISYTIESVSGYSTLQGTISKNDSQGNAVGLLSGATISVSGVGQVDSDELGKYRFENLPAGTCSITVSKSGYHPSTRQVTIGNGGVYTENFSLTPQASAGTPQSFGFESSTGSHVIDNMPEDIRFRTQVAWNGSMGSVRFNVAGVWHSAAVTDQGNGTAIAEITLAAPDVIVTCTELTLEVTNGEGWKKFVNLGVHFTPTGDVIPWYRDNIAWTPSGASISYSDGYSFSMELPTKSTSLELKCAFGYDRKLSYDFMGASYSSSLAGSGSLGFSLPSPNPKVKLLGSAGMNVEGELQGFLAGCDAPEMTPSWSIGFSGSAGFKAPVVLALDFVAPGAGTTLAQIPGIDSLKLKLLLKAHGSLSGEYKNYSSGDCFLGSTGLTSSVGGGFEGTALVEIGKKIETGVYVGGDGAWSFGLCPDFTIEKYTGTIYVGAYAEVYGFEAHEEVSAEMEWDFTDGSASSNTLAVADLNSYSREPLWQPIGKKPERWGNVNRLVEPEVREEFPALMTKVQTGTEDTKVIENVIGLASPAVFSDNSGSMILYAHHDTEKPWYAATDIGSILNDGGNWISARVTDDQAAEFNPVMADVGNNQLLTAWTRVSGDTSEAQSPEEIVPYLEIVTSLYDRLTQIWSTPVPLTANAVVDRDPLPLSAGGRHGVIWIQNQGEKLVGDSISGDSLLYRQWDGANWSAPVVLFADQKGVPEFTGISDGNGEAFVVFCVDEDGDAETLTDRELYRIQTVEGVWQTPVRLTDDDVEDSLPVLMIPNGLPMLVWKSGETLKYTGLSDWNPVVVFSQETLSGEAPTLDGATMPGGAAIAYTIQGKSGVDIVAAFYDANLDIWSLPVQLTDDEHAESALSLAYDGVELVMAYLKTQTLRQDIDVELNGQIQTIPNVPQPGRTDLYVLRHTLGRDLAVAENSLKTVPVNPAPDSTATLVVTVANSGDIAVDDIPVAFYDGDPATGGTLIGQTTTTGTLIAGSSQNVQMAWQVPQSSDGHQVFVVIDPELTIEDRNRTNNLASIVTSMPDLMVTSTKSDQISGDTMALTAQISNTGVVPSGSFTVSWRLGTADGPEIATATVDTVLAGAYHEVTSQWVAGISGQTDDYARVYVIVDTAAAVTELNEDNNTGLQSVHLPYATGSLTVTIVPPEAVAAGVEWSIDGGKTWYASGTTVVLPAGNYTVIFKPVPGYTLPAIANVAIGGSESVNMTGDPDLAGDISGDSTIDLSDVIIALQVISSIEIYPIGAWYDVNGDGKIGMAEAIHVLQKMASE